MRGGDHVGPGHAGRSVLSWCHDARSTIASAVVALCMLVTTALSCVSIPALAASDLGTVTAGRADGQPATAVYCTFEITIDGIRHTAYCAEAPWEGPTTGDVYVLQGETHIDALDYVLYHGYDGKTVINLTAPDGSVLDEARSRAATQAAAWMAIGSAYPGNYDDWNGYTEYTEKFRAHDAVGYQTAVALYDAARAYSNLPSAVRAARSEYRFSTLWSKQGDLGRSSGSHCQMLVMVGDKEGWIEIKKASSEPSLTTGNSSYTFGGAQFGVYSDEACAKLVQTLTTGEDGSVKGESLAAGTYWVKEIAAPQGYALDATVHKVVVVPATSAELSVANRPIRAEGDLYLQKLDMEGDAIGAKEAITAQGGGTLSGAELTLSYYDAQYESLADLPDTATRSWVYTTDEHGLINLASTVPRGSELYRTSAGKVVFPLGTYTVTETKAPAGYELSDSSIRLAHVVEDPSSATGARWEWGDGWGGSHYSEGVDGRAISDLVKRGGISLKKTDAEGGPQGDATLEGITFGVINRNANPVYYDGVAYQAGAVISGLVLVTDSEGYAATARNALPIGDYEVFEAESNDGYLLAEETKTVTIAAGSAGKLAYVGEFEDRVKRGGVRGGKVSAQSLLHRPEGAATFEGTVLGIRLTSSNPVLVDGVRYRCGDTVAKITLDANGVGETAQDALPYGSYELYEVEAPEGELLNTTWTCAFQIREHNEIVDLSSEQLSVADQVIRGDVEAVKAVESSQERLANVPFVIESLTTGEWHVLVSDENGYLSTESSWNAHSQNTNANDALVSREDDGSYHLAEAAEEPDVSAGVWFDGYADVHVAVDDSLGALPYDRYRLVEVGVPANEGLVLVDLPFTVYREGRVINLGTLDNQPGGEPPVIGTELTYDGNHVAPVAENVTLVDTVSYRNLEPGMSYLLSGELHLVNEDGSDGGMIAQAERAFTCVYSAGTAEVLFVVDTSELAGRTTVAFETLYLGEDEVAAHADITDEGQTVRFPSIGTTLASSSGSKAVSAVGMIELVDTVAYQGLEPGRSYMLHGTLMDKVTGEKVLVDDSPVRAEATFIPSESAGTTEVTFVFDATKLAGRSVVAFEDLVGYTVHADLEDEDQTVSFPRIGTVASVNGMDEACANGQVTIVDVVNYENLEAGATYKLVGTLMDASTESAVENEGVVICAEASLVPERPNGQTQLELTFDATEFEGHNLVVFERLVRVEDEREELIASHEDISDGCQTVHFPQIGTTLVDSETSSHETVQGAETTLIDTVRYHNLVPDREYVVTGELHLKTVDGDDEGVLVGPDGDPVTASTTFVPENTDGEVELAFTFDTSALGGRTVVAFETVSREGLVLAVHADISDENQSVHVPHIQTTLTEAESGKHEVLEAASVTLNDVVAFSGLTPGESYEMKGSLVFKDTGKPLVANGQPVVGTATFTPTASSGNVVVVFTFNATNLGDKSVVAFETLYRGDTVVAAHADLNDEGQTVRIAPKPEEPKQPDEPKKTRPTSTPVTGDLSLPWPLFAFLGLAFAAVGFAAHGKAHPNEDMRRTARLSSPRDARLTIRGSAERQACSPCGDRTSCP